MINKQVIFNVGGALSSYIEFDGNKVVVDLGKSDDFNPVEDFLLPLAKKRNSINNSANKHEITQAFLSHQDNDHISCIMEFDKYFFPLYLTVPTPHPKQDSIFNVIIKFIFKPKSNNVYSKYLINLMSTRSPGHGRVDREDPSKPLQEDRDRPLVVYPNCAKNIELYHIPAGICGRDEILKENYSNNISLVLFVDINGHTIFMPGDLMKDGMEYLLKTEKDLKNKLQTRGVDFLIAPHHGLSTSFPGILFNTMKNGKTNRLNIISEKKRKSDSDEQRSDVDSRYYDKKYCAGNNNLDGQIGRKTSEGHIVIDYSSKEPFVKIIETKDKDTLINEFI